MIIYNTCSVREHAEQKVWSRLGEMRDWKDERPGLVIGVIGCMAERDGANIFRKYPHVDILCGPGELDKLPGMVHNAVVTQRDRESPIADCELKTIGNPQSAIRNRQSGVPDGRETRGGAVRWRRRRIRWNFWIFRGRFRRAMGWRRLMFGLLGGAISFVLIAWCHTRAGLRCIGRLGILLRKCGS